MTKAQLERIEYWIGRLELNSNKQLEELGGPHKINADEAKELASLLRFFTE